MPHIDLMQGCNDSVSGIKTLRLCAKKFNGDPLNFPVDVIFLSGGTETLILQDNVRERKITINEDDFEYRIVKANFAEFNQEIVESRQGIIYRKTITFSFPKINLTTNNQIRQFLFGQGEQFAISNIMAFITDVNNQDWIVGWDLGLVLEEFDLQTDKRNGENVYVFRYESESYLPALKYVTI